MVCFDWAAGAIDLSKKKVFFIREASFSKEMHYIIANKLCLHGREMLKCMFCVRFLSKWCHHVCAYIWLCMCTHLKEFKNLQSMTHSCSFFRLSNK